MIVTAKGQVPGDANGNGVLDAGDALDALKMSVGLIPLKMVCDVDSDGQVNRDYRVQGLPTSVFVNQHGIIQFVHIGFMTEGQLDGYLAQMGLGEETALDSGIGTQ